MMHLVERDRVILLAEWYDEYYLQLLYRAMPVLEAELRKEVYVQ